MSAHHGVQVFRLTGPARSRGSSAALPSILGLMVICGAIAAMGLGVVPHRPAATIFFGAGTIAMATYLGSLLIAFRGGRWGFMRVVPGESGLAIAVSRAAFLGDLIGTAVLVAAATWLGAQLVSDSAAGPVWFLGMASFALIAVAGLLKQGRCALQPSLIEVRPAGLLLGAKTLTALPWGALDAVGFDRRGMAFHAACGVIHVRTTDLRSDPYLVAELIDYYRCHPDQRDELGDHRAIQRIRLHQFVATTVGGVGS